MRIKDYIEASYELLREGKDEALTLTKLKLYLQSRGLSKVYPSVLRGLMEKIRRSEKHTRTKVIVARNGDAELQKKEIAKALQSMQGTEDSELIIDESIIGGFMVKGKNERLDRSYKNKLLHVYHTLTD